MPNLRSILCPVDFSDQSQEALRWAAALSARYGAHLTVLTAVDPLLAEAARARLHMDLAKTETDPALRTFVRDTLPESAAGALQVSFDVRVWRADESILEAASHGVDLAVMGTHGLGGFRKWLLGSTTERVLRRTTTAVLAVAPPAGQAIDVNGPRLDLKTILVGTDFSDASAAAGRWAEDLARELGASVLLAHVVAPMLVASRWQSYVADMDRERMREAEAKLETLSDTDKGGIVSAAVVSMGQPAESLATLAKERRAGMIAIGLMSEQEADSRAARPGSIAYRLLCLADVPVLVVPRPR